MSERKAATPREEANGENGRRQSLVSGGGAGTGTSGDSPRERADNGGADKPMQADKEPSPGAAGSDSGNHGVDSGTGSGDNLQGDSELLKLTDSYRHGTDNNNNFHDDFGVPTPSNDATPGTHINSDLGANAGNGHLPREDEHLDLLLQHYQNVLGKQHEEPQGRKNHSELHEHQSCDLCLQQQKQCIYVPDIGNCVECETKHMKCCFTDNNNNKRPYQPQLESNQTKRVNTGNSSPQENKAAEVNPEYYSKFLQSLNGSMTTPGNTNQFDNQSPGPMTGKGQLPRPQSQPVIEQSAKVALPQHSVSQTSLKKQQPPQQQQQIQYPRSSFYVGPTSIFDISIIDRIKLDNIDQIQISKTLALRKVAPKVQFLLRDDYNQKLYSEQEQQVDIVERLVHPHGKLLVEIFFKRVHPYFPILHERVFLEKYVRSYRELTTPLLASIYSLALQWWDFHPKLIGFPKPEVVELLNEIAFKTFFERIERPKLSMIQTGLLLLQCRSESPNNWVLCSNVVALAEELGLGVSCQDWKLPKWEKDLRKRLAWAVWATDKWTSLIEGRHSHLILGRNWMVNILRRSDFPPISPIIQGFGNLDSGNAGANAGSSFNINASNIGLYDMSLSEEEYVNGNIMFQQMVSLSIIVGEIMDTFYTQGAIHVNTNIEQVLKLAKPLQLKLREWYHSLPPQLSMNTFTPKKFNSNATLTLIYFAAEITLHRKIISSLKSNTPKELIQVCRTAAKTRLIAAIEFVGDLKNEHINAFWYSCSTGDLMLIGTFAALLYVTAPTKEEATTFRDLMRNYIWVLRVRSKSFDKLRNALGNIHMLLAQIPGLLTDDEPANTTPAFRTPSVSATPKIGGSARPNLNANHPISQDIFHGLGNLVDSTTQLNNFGNDMEMEGLALREGNFHHGSPSSYASTPTIENELMMNMVNEHRARLNNRSNPMLFEDNQSPKSDLQGNQGSPSYLNQKKPQFSPKHAGNSPSPRITKPGPRSPSRAGSIDSHAQSQAKRQSVDTSGPSGESQAARRSSTSEMNSGNQPPADPNN